MPADDANYAEKIMFYICDISEICGLIKK